MTYLAYQSYLVSVCRDFRLCFIYFFFKFNFLSLSLYILCLVMNNNLLRSIVTLTFQTLATLISWMEHILYWHLVSTSVLFTSPLSCFLMLFPFPFFISFHQIDFFWKSWNISAKIDLHRPILYLIENNTLRL